MARMAPSISALYRPSLDGSRAVGGIWPACSVLYTVSDPTRVPALFFHLQRILDVVELCEFRVPEFAVDLLNLADVNGLHDVAGLRIDRHDSARAFPSHAFHCRDKTVTIGLTLSFLERLRSEERRVGKECSAPRS